MFTVAAHKVNGQVAQVQVWGGFPTLEAAQEFAAGFPKSWGVRTCPRYTLDNRKEGGVYLFIKLKSDGVNRGKNEAGINRARKFLSRVEFTYTMNAGNSATEAEFRQVLGL